MTDRLPFVLNDLKRACQPHGQKKVFAKKVNTSQSYLSELIKGNHPLPDDVLAAIGWKRIVTYQRVKFGVKPK